MKSYFLKAAALFGRKVLPYSNPRVVCPPGQPGHYSRPNILVATPMRSGTHLVIDMLLNNLPAYRTQPLYINLDQCLKPKNLSGADPLIDKVSADSGYVIKTHLPIGTNANSLVDPRLEEIIKHAIVVTVRRDPEAIAKSLEAWSKTAPEGKSPTHKDDDYDLFWSYWDKRDTISLQFEDLFDADKMRQNLSAIATAAQTDVAPVFRGPPPAKKRLRILLGKAATRLLGHRAVYVDTTIHTLKK